MAECYDLCVLFQFAGLHQASGTFHRCRKSDPSRRRKAPIGCPISIGSKYRIPTGSLGGIFRSRPLSSDPAGHAGCLQVHPGIPSDFHIAVARFPGAPAIFPDPDKAPARVPMERRQQRLLRILLLHLGDIRSEGFGRLLARYCHSSSCERPPYGGLHTGNMVLIATACHCIRAYRRQTRHSYRRAEPLPEFFRSSNCHRYSDHPLVRPSDVSRRLFSTGRDPSAPSCPPAGRGLPARPSG